MRYKRPIALLTLLLLSSCAIGPDYKRPELPVPAEFKQSRDWKIARPLDMAPRGQWWQMFCDTKLNALQEELLANNQNIKIAEARFRQAQALVAQSRSSYFPAISVDSGISRGRTSTAGVANRYDASLSSSWEVDIWGRIRRSAEASEAGAAASESDLLAAQLSAQAELATNYLSLRIADEQKRLLDETVTAYARSLQLTQDLYESGIQTRSDYLQAKVQLESARAQSVNVGVDRASFEHAIAVLVGKAPSDFSIPVTQTVPVTPILPETVPSDILERRPDVAASERRVAAANANIGVARAAFFPKLTLSAAVGYASSSMTDLFTNPSRIWSLGPDIALPLFDAGLRAAQTDQAIASYDETVATYRQTVLGAFQEVENNLAALRILGEEENIRREATLDARASTELITNQYREGITSYLNVANAQTTELNNALSALTARKQRLIAAVNLVKAVGGTWKRAAVEPAVMQQ